jgi:hypothetical protein
MLMTSMLSCEAAVANFAFPIVICMLVSCAVLNVLVVSIVRGEGTVARVTVGHVTVPSGNPGALDGELKETQRMDEVRRLTFGTGA